MNNILNIYGPSGSGKTTLISWLIKNSALHLIIKDVDWGRYSEEAIRNYSLSAMPVPAFEGTIKEYLRLFCIKTSDYEYWGDEIGALLDTVRGRHSSIEQMEKLLFQELSAGEQRRLSIARAIISRQVITIIDEPYANSDKSLYSIIDRAMGTSDKLVIITHTPMDHQSVSQAKIVHVDIEDAKKGDDMHHEKKMGT